MLKGLSKPMQVMLVAVLALAAYFVLMPMLSPAPPAKTATKTTAKPLPKGAPDAFLPIDAQAHFTQVSAPLKDSFKPLIAIKAKVSAASAMPNVLPPEFAGGEQNWSYTGSAQIDGILQALLENKGTGDSIFLRVGDSWKGISVEEITDDSLVLASPETGGQKKLTLPTEEMSPGNGGPNGFAPAQINNPPLRGNIGPLTAVPDPTAQQDPNGGMMPNNGNFGNFGGGGRRGGGRRNRGGGGNGGFGG